MMKSLSLNDVRRWYPEDKLREMAEEISGSLVTRAYVDGSYWVRRPTTESEKAILFNIAFGALLGLNYGEDVRSCRRLEQAILSTVEFTSNEMLPDTNGYETIYNPLRRALGDWELEAHS